MAVPEQGRDQTDGKGRRTEHSHPNTAEGLRRKADRKQQPERQKIHQRRRAEDRARALIQIAHPDFRPDLIRHFTRRFHCDW